MNKLGEMTEFEDSKTLRRRFTNLTFGIVVSSLLILGGCVSKSDSSTNEFVDNTEPANKLYNEALANISAGRTKEARKKFKAIDKQHPYSNYAKKALVMSTFTAYRAGEYSEAINHGNRYVTIFPGSKDAGYVQYLVGMSHFRQIPDVTRDQASTQRAIRAMSNVIERFPESDYVDDAKSKIRIARDQLAGKEMQIGRYYLERKEYLASVNRFRNVVERFENTRHVEEALARLTESYYSLGLVGEAQTAAAVLGHNFPDSKWYHDSYKLLQTGGLEPRENKGSWISRAGKLITG